MRDVNKYSAYRHKPGQGGAPSLANGGNFLDSLSGLLNEVGKYTGTTPTPTADDPSALYTYDYVIGDEELPPVPPTKRILGIPKMAFIGLAAFVGVIVIAVLISKSK